MYIYILYWYTEPSGFKQRQPYVSEPQALKPEQGGRACYSQALWNLGFRVYSLHWPSSYYKGTLFITGIYAVGSWNLYERNAQQSVAMRRPSPSIHLPASGVVALQCMQRAPYPISSEYSNIPKAIGPFMQG